MSLGSNTRIVTSPMERPGGSRAAQRRQKKRAKSGCGPGGGPCSANASAPVVPIPSHQASASGAAVEPMLPAAPLPAGSLTMVPPRPPREEDGASASSGSYREWMMEFPDKGDALHDALKIALEQAASIQGRKYRYGALLLAGEDLIPIKSGSNKKPFMRDNIHAEMSVLKGCDRPRGKDMLIARVAPSKRTRPDVEDDESDVEESDVDRIKLEGTHTGDFLCPPARAAADLSVYGKVLNARPCPRCEAKMVARGVRRCLFTINSRSLGVLEYNPSE